MHTAEPHLRSTHRHSTPTKAGGPSSHQRAEAEHRPSLPHSLCDDDDDGDTARYRCLCAIAPVRRWPRAMGRRLILQCRLRTAKSLLCGLSLVSMALLSHLYYLSDVVAPPAVADLRAVEAQTLATTAAPTNTSRNTAKVTTTSEASNDEHKGSSSSFATVYYDFPEKPFIEAHAMVESAIGRVVVNDPTQNPLRNCSVTTQFRLLLPETTAESASSRMEPWILQALQGNGTPKTHGGDEVYVTWHAPNDAHDMGVAFVTDRHDGTYALEFIVPPLIQQAAAAAAGAAAPQKTALGRLTLHYDYTCGIGSLMSPVKDQYARAGEVQTSFRHDAVPRPATWDFVAPNRDAAIDLSRYDSVICFGDSLMLQLGRRYKASAFWSPKLSFGENVSQMLSNPKEAALMMAKLRAFHGEEFRVAAASNESIAVIAGSSVWDVMRGGVRPGFAAHLAACRYLLHTARSEFPHVDFYWKSPSAVVLHRRAPLSENNDTVWLSRSRYISDDVPHQLHFAQKALMEEMGVPFLDLYDAYYLSAPWSIPGDSRHFQDEVSALLLSYYWPGLDLNGYYNNPKKSGSWSDAQDTANIALTTAAETIEPPVTTLPAAPNGDADVGSTYYHFPTQPFLQAQSLAREAIGATILGDPTQNPLRNCSVSTQFRLLVPATSVSEPWILQSMHGNGTRKTYGGDEVYVEWRASDDSNDMAVALVTDRLDGTYALDFILPPLLQQAKMMANTRTGEDKRPGKNGNLTLHYDYTCGIGSFVFPAKENYTRAGEVQVSFHHEAIPRPPIRDFAAPNQDSAVDLSQHDVVCFFGDSLMLQLSRRYMESSYWSPKIRFVLNVNQMLSKPSEADLMLTKLRDFHGAQFREAAAKNQSIAALVGSSVWDITCGGLRAGFQEHLAACKSFLSRAQTEFPHVHFYWKSPSALVLHRRGPLAEIGDPVWLGRSRYLSDTAPRQLNLAQKALMEEMGVPFLDLYDAYYLSAPWSRDGDSRHYEDEISSLLLSYYWPGLNQSGVYYGEKYSRSSYQYEIW